jgi:hypothetical protein
MWIESDDDYAPVPGDWIAQRLRELWGLLLERDPAFRDRGPRMFLPPSPFYAAVARGDDERAVGSVCSKYGLDPDRVRVRWVTDIAQDRVAAHVRTVPQGPIDITVRQSYRGNPSGFGTIIAHELGHAYLTDLDVPNGGAWEYEATTDLVTFLVGLGKLTVNGVGHVGPGERAGSKCYGYLNREAVVFAYAQVARLYGVPLAECRAELLPAPLGYFNTLFDEPGVFTRLARFLRRLVRRPAGLADRDLVVDEAGNVVDRATGQAP